MKKDNIPGFPGYFVSKHGRIYSRIKLVRIKGKRGCTRIYSEDWIKLKPTLKKCSRGIYRTSSKLQVSLYKPNDKKVYTFKIHKLVAMIYVPNPYNYPYVLHRDDNGSHNDYTNLVWGNAKMNVDMMISNHLKRGKDLIKSSTNKIKMVNTKGKDNPMYGSIRLRSKYFKPSEILNEYLSPSHGLSKNKHLYKKIRTIHKNPKVYLSYLNYCINHNHDDWLHKRFKYTSSKP